MIKLVINPELRDYLPSLTESERESLHLMLKRDGVRDSIKYWFNPASKNYEIIDGHNRFEWATENDRPYKAESVDFLRPNIANVKMWMLKTQEGRRGGGTIAKTIEIVKLEAEANGLPEPPKKEIRDEVMKRTGASRQATERKLSDGLAREKKPKLSMTDLKRLIEALKAKIEDAETLAILDEILAKL